MTRALIFDLDGTLIDTVYAHVFAWQRALAEAGLPIEGWRIHRRIGMSGGRHMNEKPASWRERLDALRYIPPLGKLVWQTHRGFTLAMMSLRFARAFVPVAAFWVGKLILDTYTDVFGEKDGDYERQQLGKIK